MDQDKLQSLLDSLDEGPLGKRKEHEWDASQRMKFYNESRSSEQLSKSIKNRINKGWKPEVNHFLKRNSENRTPLKAFTLTGEYIKTFESINQASAEIQCSLPAIIGALSRKGTVKEMIFIKEEDFSKELLAEFVNNAKHLIKPKIGQYDLNGNLVKVWDTALDAKKIYGPNVYKAIRTSKDYKGFFWKKLPTEE